VKAFFATVALFAMASTALANCAPREIVADRLASKYGEAVQNIGINDRGQLVEIFANIETGSWTVVQTSPGGPACVVAAGQGFQRVGQEATQGDPT
jgi:hypothetical protein